MTSGTVCIFGGSGFVGHHIVNQLYADGWQVIIPSRHPQRHRDLLVQPGVSLIHITHFNDVTLKQLLKDCDVVINLIGILNESQHSNNTFHEIHVALARQILRACQANAVPRLLHMSALNADAARGPSCYLRSKGEAENIIHQANAENLHVTSFRPSVIFGPEDSFINRFAALLRITPLLPLACPNARFAPVYVADVARAFVGAINNKFTFGRHYNLCGPREYSLKELVEYTAQTAGLKRKIIGLGDGLSRLQARVLEKVPGKPFTMDNYNSMKQDSVCSDDCTEELGLQLTPLESVVPQYLGKQTLKDRFQVYRAL